MAYRPTAKTQARKAAVRQRVLDAAFGLVAAGGFGALSIQAVATGAGIATGAVYLHFPSKAELCAEVFRIATEREVAQVSGAAQAMGSPAQRLAQAVRVFAERALRGRRIAYALIAEPVDPVVDAERLRYRQAYARVFERLVNEGVQDGTFAAQDAGVSAAALVGVIAEALIGPLSAAAPPADQTPDVIEAIQAFCLRAVGASA